jgi:hypothetical protein
MLGRNRLTLVRADQPHRPVITDSTREPTQVLLPSHIALRYVQPLREGGSLPAVVDTDDGLFVVKFRGAGQGAKALIAELIGGLLARALELPTPDVASVDLPALFGRSEGDPEIQEILRKSHGVNVGLRYLDGAFNFDGCAAADVIAPDLAARIVWFDALLTNPDRTHRNPNLLVWQQRPWLIDHGAALYAQHDWASVTEERARTPFQRVRDHVLLACADAPRTVDAEMRARLTDEVIAGTVAAIPDALFEDESLRSDFAAPDEARERYRWYLTQRREASPLFVAEADAAQVQVRASVPQRRTARR